MTEHADRSMAIRAILEALNAGRPGVAIEACAPLLAELPDDAALNQLAATAALRLGRFAEAERLARRSLAIRPRHVPTLIVAGRVAGALEDHAGATDALALAAECQPENAEAVFLLAATRLSAGSALDAREIDRLAARFPAEQEGWDALVEAALGAGQKETAVLCLSARERVGPSFATSMRRGLIAKDLGRPAEARRAFTVALSLRPRAARAWFLLGVVSQDLRDLQAAEKAYARALALDPNLAEAAVNLGTSMQEQGDIDGAKEAYSQAVKARPDTFGRVAQALVTSPRGELWLDLGRLRRSLAG